MNQILDINLMHPRDQVTLIITRIYNRGLTTTSGGNISMLDENGDIWITPSGVDKGSMKPSDIMCIRNDGSISGRHKPSSEFPFHKAIYDMRPDIKAIIHAHPPALVSFSIVREVPDTSVLAQAYSVCGDVGYASYELPGSNALGSKISNEFAKGYHAIIMENHGTVIGGSDLANAYGRFETLELCASTILKGKTIGEVNKLTSAQLSEYLKQTKHCFSEIELSEYYSDEKEIRTEICSIVRRACNQGLMTSYSGTVSTRWRGNDFLITPSDISRWDLKPEQIVRIKEGKREAGKEPDISSWLHQEIYKKHPEINSVISAQSPNLMAFAITHVPFDVRTIPESWIFLQDVLSLPFGSQFSGRSEIPDLLSDSHPAVIITNDSVLVTGNKLLQTFDKLEVAEFSAKSIIMSTPIGKMVPIGSDQIEDLRDAFLKK